MKTKYVKILVIALSAIIVTGILTAVIIHVTSDRNKPKDTITGENNDNNDDDSLKGSNIVYIKDNEIYYTNIVSMESFKVTEELYDSESPYPEDILNAFKFSQVSSDFKYLYYTDHALSGPNKFPLYRMDPTQKDSKPEKIADSVHSYKINNSIYYKQDGKKITKILDSVQSVIIYLSVLYLSPVFFLLLLCYYKLKFVYMRTNKMKTKYVKILVIALSAIIVTGILTAVIIHVTSDRNKPKDTITGENNDNNDDDSLKGSNIVYIKDNEIYYTNIDSMESFKVTEELYDSESPYPEDILNAFKLSQVSSDFKYLYYTDHALSGPNKFPLYRMDLTQKDSKPEKIADSVHSYKINNTGTKVYYIDDIDVSINSLYEYDFEKTEKITSNIIEYYIDSDGSNLLYYDGKGVFLKTTSNTEEITDLNLEMMQILKVTEDLNFYIQINNSIYYKQDGKEITKILDSVQSVIKIYDTGEIYFTNDNYQLSYFDNNNATTLSNSSFNIMSIHNEKPMIIYYTDDSIHVAKGTEVTQVEGSHPKLEASSEKIYYLDNYINEKGHGELVEFNLLTKAKTIIDTEVCSINVPEGSNKIYYTKNLDDIGYGELFTNKNKVDSKVNMSDLRIVNDNLIFFTGDQEAATMKAYDGTNATVVANKVYPYYSLLPEGIAFLKDYDYETGDIYLFDGTNEAKLITSKVKYFSIEMPIFNYEYVR